MEEPFYEWRVPAKDEKLRGDRDIDELLRRTSALAPRYHPSHLSRAINDPGYFVKEPPWWRPFARRRYRIALQVLNDFAEEELTDPPS